MTTKTSKPARHSLPFTAKLALGFAAAALAAIAAVLTPITLDARQRATRDIREKALTYARLIGPQLSQVVAFDDALTAREVFAPFESDRDVAGLAVYTASGTVIEGIGQYPARIQPGEPIEHAGAGRILVVAPVVSREGPKGTLAVMLSTESVHELFRSQLTTAALCAALALSISALIAVFAARTVAGRLRGIALAANEVAQGDYDRPAVQAGANDEIGSLVRAFNTMVEKVREQFAERRQLAESEQARLESLVQTRTAQLEESREQYRLIAESTNAIPFTYLPNERRFIYVGPQVEKCLGYPHGRWVESDFLQTAVVPNERETLMGHVAAVEDEEREFECGVIAADRGVRQLRWVVTAGEIKGQRCLRGLILDITHQRKLEADLQQAQKLESVGRLASGIAHEINTPVQFVSDNVYFLREAAVDLQMVVGKMETANGSILSSAPDVAAAAEAEEAAKAADLPYLAEEMPRAFDRVSEGLHRIAAIVRSMKEFARPDSREMVELDLKRAVENTLTIAANEYKYVAELCTELEELPPVKCHGGEINQVVLNIVVNAAHAIGDVVKDSGGKGRITVRIWRDGDMAVISIADTGGGIPEHDRTRIFDPFFTTKDVGKGTGQGLAIARSVVVDKHGGELTVESDIGKGSTFHIRLPIGGTAPADSAAA